jgi:cupin fold WbuC family metalloprotein
MMVSNMNNEALSAFSETKAGVFHSFKWGQIIPETFIGDLIECAKKNSDRKARLCLHPSPNDVTQVTILALVAPYKDRLHKHPNKPEIMFPIKGKAELTMLDQNQTKQRVLTLDAGNPVPVSIQANTVHALKVLSNDFVFIEIGNGPFNSNSTVYV